MSLKDLFEDESTEDVGIDWKKEWVGMPEYKQVKIMPHDEVIVRFKSEQDKIDFFDLIKQNIPSKLKSIWFPKVEKTKVSEIYVDES